MFRRSLLFFLTGAILLLSAGCATPFTTNTKRSAVEQYLLAVTIERLTQHAGLEKYAGKKVFFEYKYLKTQEDVNYLKGRLEMFMSKHKCIIVDKPDKAQIIIQVICGVLGTDYNTVFIGTPALPLPLPETSLNVMIPEIPIFKIYDRKAYGRVIFNIMDAKTKRSIEVTPEINASSTHKNWVILLIPFTTRNFSMEDTKNTSTHIDFIP